MTEVYSAELRRVVATGDAYAKRELLYYVPNCLPLDGPQVGERYMLRDGDKRPVISVECVAKGQPGIQTAHFKEV